MALVFISHSSLDNKETKKVTDELVVRGFKSFFLDFDLDKGIKGGEDWEKKLYSQLDKCHIVLLLLSPSWVKSKWCFVEYTYARILGKEIIPVIIEHGKNNEINNAISTYIQKIDITSNREAISDIIKRINEISLNTQRGFEWDNNRSPYPGMVSFEKKDAAIFFGREKETKSIIEKLNAMKNKNNPKSLNIIATSGMGKSSLLKAGVLATLELIYKDKWLVLPVLIPSKKPLYEFTKILIKYTNKNTEDFKIIYENLQTDNYQDTLDDVLTDIEFSVDDFNSLSILIPIDQAEEFYTSSEEYEKKCFYQCFSYLLQKQYIFAISTMRADFLKDYQVDIDIKDIQESTDIITLPPMREEKIYAVIKKPAKVCSINVDDELIERIKLDVKTLNALPILALCLNQMYEKHAKYNHNLTLEDYYNLGNKNENPLDTIIKNIVNEAMNNFTEEEQNNLKYAFIPHLVSVNEQGDYVKISAPLNNLPTYTHSMIEALVKARLLLKNDNEISIVHEALIQKWELLYSWLQNEHEFLLGKSHLEVSLKEWKEAGKNEKAFLSGLRLSKASIWLKENKDYLTDEEKNFIKLSIQYNNEQEKLYKIAQEDIIKANHNTGLFLLEKVKNEITTMDISKVIYYSYNALNKLSKKYDLSQKESSILSAKQIIKNYCPLHLIFSKKAHEEIILDLAVSPDKKTLVSCSFDNTIKLWDIESGKELSMLYGHTDSVNSVKFLPDGKTVVSASSDTTLKLWDIKSCEEILTFEGHLGPVNSIAISSDGKIMVSASADATLKIWNIESCKEVSTLKGHKGSITSIAFSPDDKILVSGSKDGLILLWDIKSDRLLEMFDEQKGEITSVAISPDCKTLVATFDDGTIIIRKFHLKNNNNIIIFKPKGKYSTHVVFSVDGNKIITGHADGDIRIWDIKNKQCLYTLKRHYKSVTSIVIPSDQYIISAGEDCTIKFWDIGNINKYLYNRKNINISCLAVSKIKKLIAVGMLQPNSIHLRDIKSGIMLQEWKVNHEKRINSISFSPNGKIIVSGSLDNTIKVWDVENGKLLATFRGHTDSVSSVVISPDGETIVSGSFDKTIKIWDIKSGRVLVTFRGHTDSVTSVTISPDGRTVVSGSKDATLKLWDIEKYNEISTLKGHKVQVNSVKFSLDGKTVVSGSSDGKLMLWDIGSREMILTLVGNNAPVHSVAFSPDGKIVVSGSNNMTVRLWNIERGKLISTLVGHKKSVHSVEFLPDGKTVISSSNESPLMYWELEKGDRLNDVEYLENKLKFYELELQGTLKNTDFQNEEIPFMKPIWLRNHRFYWFYKAKRGDSEAMYQLKLHDYIEYRKSNKTVEEEVIESNEILELSTSSSTKKKIYTKLKKEEKNSDGRSKNPFRK